MPFRIVQSKQNARLKELRQALAHPGRNSRGLAGIEGPNLLEESLRAGLRIDCVFAAQGSEHLLDGLELPLETEILLLPRDLLDSALATEAPQSIAALVKTPGWSWEDLLDDKKEPDAPSSSRAFREKMRLGWEPLILVLAGLQDPGNLGTVLRSAEAFGANGVLSLPGTVSPWNSKAVRASAGSVFRLPLLAVTAEECFSRLRVAGVKIWTTAVQGAEAVHTADLAGATAILIGNEGNGIPSEVAAQADGSLTIPCPGPVESLNASIAASILLYEASRQRGNSASHLDIGRMGSHPLPKTQRMGHGESLHPSSMVGGKR